MTRRIRVFPSRPCVVSARLLSETLRSGGLDAKRLRREGSRFTGRNSDLIINYGASDCPDFGDATVLNSGAAVALASNKTRSLTALQDAGVIVPEFTTSRSVAEGYLSSGKVYQRTKLTGHSGEGIVVAETASDLVDAPLYVKALPERHREYRAHVFNNEVILLQQKKRRSDYDGTINNEVRNHSGGWIYAVNDVTPVSDYAKSDAVLAVQALGLDFGAVDIVTNGDHHWILEVNTAPGLSGDSSKAALVAAIVNYLED